MGSGISGNPVGEHGDHYPRRFVSDTASSTPEPSRQAVATRSSFAQRVERLQRLEEVRLSELALREERRCQRILGEKPSGGRHDLVDRIERVTRYPMILLGLAWLVVGIVVVTTDVRGSASIVLVGTLFALWAIALVEYLVRLLVTPDRKGYLKRRWPEPATVVLPVFQSWHLVGIEKVGLLIGEVALRIEVVLKHHSLFRVLIAATGTLFLGAWLVLLFEADAIGTNIHNFGNALWWAIVTVTTVGYGDRFPISVGGRLVAVVLMLVGIGLIGVLTATVASVFIQEHTRANHDEIKQGHADLGVQLALIADRLSDVERRLGATATDADPGPSTS